jgi:hypothetical protein
MGRYSDNTITLWDIRTLVIERDDKGTRKLRLWSYKHQPNVVDYVGRQGYHYLGLPQLFMGLGAISGNL